MKMGTRQSPRLNLTVRRQLAVLVSHTHLKGWNGRSGLHVRLVSYHDSRCGKPAEIIYRFEGAVHVYLLAATDGWLDNPAEMHRLMKLYYGTFIFVRYCWSKERSRNSRHEFVSCRPPFPARSHVPLVELRPWCDSNVSAGAGKWLGIIGIRKPLYTSSKLQLYCVP